MRVINDRGMKLIKDFLGNYHKLGADHFTPAMLSAWASDAVEHKHIEIKSCDSWRGHTELLILNDGAFDQELEI